MSIQYAILGLLNGNPLSGYDLKKLIADSTIFYWSGNNNQIYKALIQLHQDGLVTPEVQYQESVPAKKVYSITSKGQAALKEWLIALPEPPELRKPFLIQLAFADQLTLPEINQLIDQYAAEVEALLAMQRETARREKGSANKNPREAYLRVLISENITASYEQELIWVKHLRDGLQESWAARLIKEMKGWPERARPVHPPALLLIPCGWVGLLVRMRATTPSVCKPEPWFCFSTMLTRIPG